MASARYDEGLDFTPCTTITDELSVVDISTKSPGHRINRTRSAWAFHRPGIDT